MANWYVDDTAGGANDGTSPTDAWTSIVSAITKSDYTPGDKVWVRRTHDETAGAAWNFGDSGEDGNPLYLIGWPRAAVTGTADVESGLKAFFDSSVTPNLYQHGARLIRNDTDGNDYFITGIGYYVPYDDEQAGGFAIGDTVTTAGGFSGVVISVVDDGTSGHLVFGPGYSGTVADNDVLLVSAVDHGDANDPGATKIGTCFIIAQEYQGTDAAAGNFTIAVDPDYAGRPTWAAADADAHNLPILRMVTYNLLWSSDYYWQFHNFNVKDGSYTHRVSGCMGHHIEGCIYEQSGNSRTLYLQESHHRLNRIIVIGPGSGNTLARNECIGPTIRFTNCAFYNMGDYGLWCRDGNLENVNLGIEQPNYDDDLSVYRGGLLRCRDVRLGGNGGSLLLDQGGVYVCHAGVENYNGVFGEHRYMNATGRWYKVFVDGTTTPNKKVSDYVLKSEHNFNATYCAPVPEWTLWVLEHEVKCLAQAYTFKYWIFNDTGETLNSGDPKLNVWLEAEYVKEYTSTTQYLYDKGYSTEQDIAQQGGDTDWDYVQVSVTPATASKVRLRFYMSYYNADVDDNLFIDPAVVIS
jgi:hypothetical protein